MIRRRERARAWVALGCVAGGLVFALPTRAGEPVEPDPFLAPVDSLAGHVRTIALAPTKVPREIEGSEEAGTDLERRLADRLAAAGFAIVPAESVRAAWQEISQSEGGMFDKLTGRRDPARYARIQSLVGRRLRDRHQADVCLQAAIVIVDANYKSGEVKWDGVARNVGAAGFLRTLLSVVPEGRMSVLSLEVDAAEPEGRPLYRRRGGLQPLRRLDDKPSALDSTATRFGDDAIKDAALDRALGPWLERVRPIAAARADSLHP